MAGGWDGSESENLNSVVVYNPERNTWKTLAPMPTARERLRLVASGRYLYAIGGFNFEEQALDTVERYDPRSNSWSTMNPLHESRAVPCAIDTTVGNRHVLVVVAGAVSRDDTSKDGRRTTEVFDPDNGRWKLLDVLLPIVRGSNDCAVELDGTVLLIGGATRIDPPAGGEPTYSFLTNVDALTLKPRDLK